MVMKKKLKKFTKPLLPLFFLTPALTVLSVFQIYPIIQSFFMGFYTKFDYITGEVSEVGFENFAYVLSDPDFILAIKNTCILSLIAAPLGIFLALILAVLLDSDIRLKKFFQTVYFIPFVTSMVAVSIVWSWMLNREYGVVNAALGVFGVAKVAWLTDEQMTLPILIALSVWKGLGYRIIILLAGLQAIDKRYRHAARIDGAGAIARFVHITLPMLKPVLIFLSITTVIGTFKTFDEVHVLYDGRPGPLKSGLTIVYYIFHKFYQEWQFARAAAAAFVLFAMILAVTLIQLALTKKKEEGQQ